jgi:hypothetical protein
MDRAFGLAMQQLQLGVLINTATLCAPCQVLDGWTDVT